MQAGERRLRHGAGEGGVADDVDVLLRLRFERHRIDRAPAGAVDDAGQACDLAGLLRRDHVGDGVLVSIEIGLDRFLRHVDGGDIAAVRQRLPRDHVGIKLLPRIEKQRLHGESVFGVENDDLGFRLIGFQIVRDHAGALVGTGRTARRIGRRDDGDDTVIGHGGNLLAQQFVLRRVRGPGVRRLRRGGFAVTFDRVELQLDAGREHEAVVGQGVAGRQRDAARLRVDGGCGSDRRP